MKRDLADPMTWREACRLMVVYATHCKPPKNQPAAYEWLKRDLNANTISGTEAHRRHLADIFYAARDGVRLNERIQATN